MAITRRLHSPGASPSKATLGCLFETFLAISIPILKNISQGSERRLVKNHFCYYDPNIEMSVDTRGV